VQRDSYRLRITIHTPPILELSIRFMLFWLSRGEDIRCASIARTWTPPPSVMRLGGMLSWRPELVQ